MAKLTVETSTSNGTEIKLVVPGSIIYQKTRSGRRKSTAIKSLLQRIGLTQTRLTSDYFEARVSSWHSLS